MARIFSKIHYRGIKKETGSLEQAAAKNGTGGELGVVIVTGAAKRVGRAIVENLAELGYPICIHYFRSSDEAESLAAQIRARGGRVVTVGADLTHSEAAARAILDACLKLGMPTTLINNASSFFPESLGDATADSFDSTMATNVKTPLILSREFAKVAPTGQIINVADWRGLHPIPGHLSYTLSKAALIALTQLLALELAPDIRVNAIAPGALLPASHGLPEELELSARNPLRRVGGTRAVVEAVDYLMKASFVTGEVLRVTGGEELAIQRGHA
jgi:NAD(P)-dependent dehydrogenase (short-subunit alcohol dehydrogenase family)